MKNNLQFPPKMNSKNLKRWNQLSKVLILFTLIIFGYTGVFSQSTFYSQANGNFSTLANWNTNPGGGGSSPLNLADMQDGNDNFIIQDGDTISLDDSININNLTVGGGASGGLTLGIDATSRQLVIGGTLTVNSGALVIVGAFNATHTIYIKGAVTNSGTIDLRNSSSQVANVILDGTFSISGNSPQFNNITFNTGTITAGVAFDIEANVTIENGATFADGGFTHTVAGDWTENGSGQMTGTGTIQMDATLVQSIKTAATFNNLTFSGGSVATISGANNQNILTVNGNFYVTNNTDVSSSSRHTVSGNFTVDAGSTYKANDGRMTFNSASAQSITISSGSFFDEVYFDNGGAANPKSITGDYTANDLTFVYNDAVIDGNGSQTLQELRLDGECNFSNQVTFTGGTIYENGGDSSFTVGTADILINGYCNIQTGDTMNVNGDFTIQNGYLIINNNSILLQKSLSKSLIIETGKSIYIRGDDNFPNGFSTYNLKTNSWVRYDGSKNQIVRGNITYYNLYLRFNTKTVDGSLDIDNQVQLRNGCTLDLSNYSHTVGGNITNGTNSSVASTGTLTFDASNANQTIGSSGVGTYTFNNLVFTSTATSAVRTKNIDGNITVNGNFTITNTGGSTANYIILDIDANSITNDGGDTFTMGSNVELRTSGATSFETSMNSFATVSMDPASTVRFDGTNQNIPGGFTYANIDLATTGNKTATAAMDVNGDITRTGNIPVFVDGGFSHTFAGDWNLDQDYTSMTGTITFDGADQLIDESNFYNVVFAGTGTKTLKAEWTGDGNLNVDNDLTINSGATLDASINSITIEGNWSNSNGVFHQTTGTVTFDGTQNSRTITSNSSSYFGNLVINKTGGDKTVTANSNIDIDLDFDLTANNAVFDLNGDTLNIGRDFDYNLGTTFTHNNGMMIFDGASTDQLIRLYNASNQFYDVQFKNAGIKRIYDNDMDINGDVVIYYGATLNSADNDKNINVAGDWTNNGTYYANASDVIFDGAKQTISASDFHDLHINGSDTTTLAGNITLSGELRILDGAVLDVSTSNYSINVEEKWYNNDGTNTGVFIPRQGTVTFNGTAESELYTGGATAGKQFYNVVENITSQQIQLWGDFRVQNDLDIQSGDFQTETYDVYIGGSLKNAGTFTHNNDASQITFEASSGTHEFNPGPSTFRDIIVDAAGATYQLTGDLTINTTRYRTFVLNNGYFDLNSYDFNLLARDGVLDINGGTFEVDSAAVVSLGYNGAITNDNGVLMFVGNSGADAKFTSNQTNTSRYPTITQNSGTFHAKYYTIEKTKGNGVDIVGGSIDATNNFSNGNFANGAGTAYLTLTGINLGAGITALQVNFSSGPTYNIQRTSGTGAITLENASGDGAGEVYDNDDADPGTLINWTFPGGIFWDGGAGDNNWNSGLNWSSNSTPNASQNIFLEHTNGGVASTYTVNISSANASCNRLTLDAEGGNAISLVINGYELNVSENVDIGASTTLTQTTATDTIFVAGNWSNGGTFNEGTSAVVFSGTSGSNSISTGGASDSFYDLVVDADGAIYNLLSAVDVSNDIKLLAGTLKANTSNITVDGNWTNSGATFDPGTAKVTFQGAAQNIGGDTFYDFYTGGSGTKTLTGNISVGRDVRIQAGTVLDGGTKTIYVTRNWRNDVGDAGFTQSGAGALILNGANQNIGNSGSSNTFNNIYFQGTGVKTVSQNMTVNGDMYIKNGINRVTLQSAVTVTGAGGANTLNMTGGELRIEGANNFPSGFESVSMSGGNTRYYSNSDQSVYSTTYYGLILQRQNSGTPTKTLLGDISTTTITLNDANTILDVNGNTITITGNFALGTGNSVLWNGGSYVHEGAGWNIDADFTEFNNLTLKGSGTKRMHGNLNITGDLAIQASGVVFDMDTYTMTNTGTGKSLSMNAGTYLYSAVVAPDTAFPQRFSSYSLDVTSTVQVDGTSNQLIDCGFTYGILNLRTQDTLALTGNLDVDGNFDMNNNPVLIDSTYDMNLAGATIDIRNYSASTNTITFDGTDQSIQNEANANPDTLRFNNLVFAGSGTKSMNNAYDVFDIGGTVTINNGVTIDSDEDWAFGGSTFTNNGSFDFTGGDFHMDGTAGQNIDPGASNIFYTVTVSNGGGNKTIINNGMDINNTITINSGATFDMGTLTHTIASGTITNNGTWTTTNASLTFDGGTQTIPAITFQDAIFSGTGNKTLSGNISVNNLTIESPRTLAVSASNDTITVTGSWTNNGTFNDMNGVVEFESSDGTAQTINNNGNNFWEVKFNQAQTNTRIYTLEDDFDIEYQLTVGNGATLDLNGHNLTLGSNQNPDVVETHTIESGGTLEVDANAILEFNNVDGTSILNVAGTFNAVGSSGNIATVTNETNNTNRRTQINITTGTIGARYYHFKFLSDSGIDVQSTATLNATNNFSDGSWSEIRTSGSGVHRYLKLNCPDPGGSISNVTFNHGGTPSVGVHYNVQRSSGATGTITFASTINGELAGATYEDDPGSKITWPVVTTVTWDGSASTDWHNAANWTPAGVPTSASDVVIPSAGNNPIINTSNASCKSLQITTGTLTVDGGYDLSIAGDITIGTSTNSGILAIGNTSSNLTVGGSWTRGVNGTFINGGSTITFTAGSGTVTIDPKDDAFNNIIFNGGATFQLEGSAIDVDGSFTISSGTISQLTSNYNLTVAGDISNTGGTYSTSTNGTITLDGAAQAITTMTFDNLTVDGTNTKTFNGANVINDLLTVNSTLAVASGGSLDMNDDVTIDAAGTFNDGGESHTFSGVTWTGTGTYTGAGTVTFDGTSNVDIYASKFNNIVFSGSGNVELYGEVVVTGDVTINSSINRFYAYTYLVRDSLGTGTFTLADGEYLYIRGTNNFPSNFATYSLGTTSYTYFDGTIDQFIPGVTYGNVYLRNATTKTLSGNVDIEGDLYFYEATLDVSASNYKINIADDWVNTTSGTFTPRSGEVIFDGAVRQDINVGTTGTNEFYKVSINKSADIAYSQNATQHINDDLRVLNGTFSANGDDVYVGGNITVVSGSIAQSGKIILNKASGNATLQFNGSTLNDLTINSGATYTLQDNLIVGNNFTLTAGTFDGNGQTVEMGGNLDIVSISGTYKIGENGYLKLGQNVSLTVNSGGTIYIVGTASGNAYVTNRSGTQRYSFNIDGTIHAKYYEFDYTNTSGVYVSSSGTIDATDNFSYGTFANPVSAGTCLKVENTQSFTDASRINDVNFPDNPGGGTYNVSKTTAGSGTLEFYNATGSFAGSSFENDPNSLINWTGPVTLTWDGSTSSDWNDSTNWTPSSGPEKVPTSSEDVIIANALNQPEITTTSDTCKSLTINSGSFLTINSSDATVDLVVVGNLDIQGNLSMNSSNDYIKVGGDWSLNGGLFTNGSGTVEMNSTSGSQALDAGSTPFYDLIINTIGTVSLTSTLNVSNDLTISSGTLDVTASNYTVNVTGNYSNSGTFTSRSGKLVLKNTAAGTKTFDPGSSSYYNLDINAGASTTYQLTNNNLTVNEGLTVLSGTFDLNSLTLNLGDGSGTDDINVSGTMSVNQNSFVKLKNGASVFVNSGGIFKLVGSDALNVATLTNQGSGTYSFTVNSGGTIHANYYLVEYINATGLWVKSGASIDEATNNFSNGTWSNGTSGGRYLLLENNFTGNFTASDIKFNVGPTYNIKRVSGTDTITVNDGFGALGGYLYEDDDLSATTGLIKWTYTNPLYTWNGGTTDWNTASNWDISIGGNGVPNNTSNVVIPNTGTDPVLNGTADGAALTVTINSGATLTLDNNYNLAVDGSLDNNGTLTIANGSSSTITVLDTWSNNGTFNPGNASTVTLTANTGTINITAGGSTFYNLTVNSGGAGTATFTTLGALDINGTLTLAQGTLKISDPAHTLNIGGNWTNTGGSFTNGNSTVTFDGAAQTISGTGTETFYDVTFAGTGTKTLSSDIIVTNDLTISSALSISDTETIQVKGNWNNTGTLSHAGTSTVSFTGTTTQYLTNTGGASYVNLTINNTSGTFPQILLNDPISITGTLTLTDGIMQTSNIDILSVTNTGSLSGGTTSSSYIDGPMRRDGTSNFVFPVGDGTIFARIGVSGMIASANLQAEYLDASYTDTTTFGAGVRNVSELEYWEMSKLSGTGQPYVTIYWEDGNRSKITDYTTLIVAHFTGGQWESKGGTPSGNNSVGYVTSTSAFSSFSPITLGDAPGGSNPLPIELLDFSAELDNNIVDVEWKTATEKNNDFFTVERSEDGFFFEPIAMIEGAGNSNSLLLYNFADENPIEGKSYYRLKQTDYDGTSSYSKIVNISFARNVGKQVNEINLYPNPATDNVNIFAENLKSYSEVEIIISNDKGSKIRSFWSITDANGTLNYQIEVSDLKTGLYFVTILSDNMVQNKQLVIK